MPSAKVGAILDLSPPTTHTPKPLGSSRTEQTPRGRRPAEEPSDCERWTSRPTRDIGLCVLRWPPRRPATLPIHPARTRMPRKLSRTPQPRRRTALVLALPAPMPGGALHNMAMSNARVFALSELQRRQSHSLQRKQTGGDGRERGGQARGPRRRRRRSDCRTPYCTRLKERQKTERMNIVRPFTGTRRSGPLARGELVMTDT